MSNFTPLNNTSESTISLSLLSEPLTFSREQAQQHVIDHFYQGIATHTHTHTFQDHLFQVHIKRMRRMMFRQLFLLHPIYIHIIIYKRHSCATMINDLPICIYSSYTYLFIYTLLLYTKRSHEEEAKK